LLHAEIAILSDSEITILQGKSTSFPEKMLIEDMISLGYVWQNHVAMCFSTGSSRRSLDFLSEIPCESSTTEKSL